MLEVAASEFDLITVARAAVGLGDPVPSILRGECALADPSPACIAALRQTLAVGCVQRLARGGWRVQDRVRRGARVRGRLWERHEAPALELTGASEALLRWATAHSLVLKPPTLPMPPATPADDLLFYLVMASAERAHVAATLARQPAIQASPLCWLGFTDELARGAAANTALPDFAWLADGLLVEALEDELAHRWVAMEGSKGHIVDGDEMIRFGKRQAEVLETFFAAIDTAGRRDLSRFVIVAASALGGDEPATASWIESLSPAVKLSARMEARTAASAFLAAIERLVPWVEAARNAHFIDDDYAAAQILLEIWETLSPGQLEALRVVKRELTSLDAIESPAGPTDQGELT